MIDMTDIPASWAGRRVRVYRPGMEIEGVVTDLTSTAEFQDMYVMRVDPIKMRQSVRREINITLGTTEGDLRFRDIRSGSYSIDLIEEN